MGPDLEIVEFARFKSPPYSCSYLPQETAELEYRIFPEISTEEYQALLCRGWRRFGCEFFRPACRACQQCRGLRVLVNEFTPSRSQRRCLKSNEQIRVVVQSPTLTPEHLRLYNEFHADMHVRRAWPWREITEEEYVEAFVDGDGGFAREFLYFDGDNLVGVGLADLLPTALSSVYFFHDPQRRSEALGVFSVLQQILFSQRAGIQHQYLGFWVHGCQSMSYKQNYRPYELLSGYPADNESPQWLLSS